MCDVTHTINENGTSLLQVELDAYHSKCLHLLANPPEDWVENIISSRCQPLCCKIWECHLKDCCKNENIEKKTSKAELILGYEPNSECIFEPIGRRRDNDDGSCVINVEIDVIYTNKIQELLPNFCESVTSIICENVELEAEEILDKVAHKGEHVNKPARDIIMEYQREEIPELEFEDVPPYVDPIKKELDTTQVQLQTTQTQIGDTQTQLQTVRTQLESNLEEQKQKVLELEGERYEQNKKIELLEMSHAALIRRLEALENM